MVNFALFTLCRVLKFHFLLVPFMEGSISAARARVPLAVCVDVHVCKNDEIN
jgi:hypothetical protein